MKQTLWTSVEITTATHGTLQNCAPETPIYGVQFDSRLVEKGDVFFALDATAHKFVGNALKSGAVLAVVDHVPEGLEHAPLLIIDKTQTALEAVGIAARQRSQAKRIGITGSVGKTSTKEMMAHVLAEFGLTHAAKASFNNHIGVPLTLARMPEAAEFGVFEIGMSHAGEITPLAGFVQPHVAIVTAVEPVHIEHFKGIEGIAHAKAEIFSGLAEGAVAIINADAQCVDILLHAAQKSAAQVLTYSALPNLNVSAYIQQVELLPDCSVVSACIQGQDVMYKIGAPGAHFALNSLAVLLTAQHFGLDLARAALSLASFAPPKGRGARIVLETEAGPILLLDESYNANPASMRAALDVLRTTSITKPGRRIAVLGEMLELGDYSHNAHTSLVDPLEDAQVDLLFCSGKAMRDLWEIIPYAMRGTYAETAAGLEMALFSALRPHDVVLLKGSNGSGIWRVVESLKTRFMA